MRIRLGTRGSELARTQSGMVADALRTLGHEVELVIVKTEGDVNLASLRTLGGLGVFAATLRTAILAGEVDFAVHSCKDLPVAPVEGLVIAAIPPRVDESDVLVGAASLGALPMGARVGTGSPRRASQLLAERPDLEVVDIRGNVGTRIGFVQRGELDAVVLAAAGLQRLGLWDGEGVAGLAGGVLGMWPAPAQGALAIECRASDAAVREVLASLDDPASRFSATAERAVLAGLQAGCAAPVATLSRFGEHYTLSARVWSEDGTRVAAASGSADWLTADPETLGREVACDLLDRGAADLCQLTASGSGR